MSLQTEAFNYKKLIHNERIYDETHGLMVRMCESINRHGRKYFDVPKDAKIWGKVTNNSEELFIHIFIGDTKNEIFICEENYTVHYYDCPIEVMILLSGYEREFAELAQKYNAV